MSEEIVNKVALSAIESLDLEQYYPREEVVEFDLKNYLFMGLILKEKDFRTALQEADWEPYRGKLVAVVCTADAIIPMWAYMLISSYLQPVASHVFFGDRESALKDFFLEKIRKIDFSEFEDKRVVVKGCGDLPVGEYAYLEVTRLLRPVAKSIMYGEPCSTVPIFKKK